MYFIPNHLNKQVSKIRSFSGVTKIPSSHLKRVSLTLVSAGILKSVFSSKGKCLTPLCGF